MGNSAQGNANETARRTDKWFAEEAEALYKSCLLVREGKSNAETLEVASVLLGYAWMSHMIGKAEEAEGKARRSLGIRERILGSQHPDVAKVLTGEALNLHVGHSPRIIGRNDTSEQIAREALLYLALLYLNLPTDEDNAARKVP